MIRIPVYQPSLLGNEKKYVNDCLDSSWISSKGQYISRFERQFSEFCGVEFASAVSNGTVALHLALLALGVGEGDEVIVPTFTYIASVNAITYVGAKPVFVDSNPETWQMDVEDVRRKMTKNTRAVMAVHLYGHPCDLHSLKEICDKAGVFLIEDCAEAIGTKFQGRHVGGFGDVSTFSFFGNKTITTGEGGMVVTNDRVLGEMISRLKGQGLAKHREYWHDIVGYNYRMTNICAAIGLAQLEQVETFIHQKRQLAEQYSKIFKGTSVAYHSEAPECFHSYWMYSVVLKNEDLRDRCRSVLSEKGIETRPFFYPAHSMPMYCKRYERHKVAENLCYRGMNLPSWPGLTSSQISEIAELVLEVSEK